MAFGVIQKYAVQAQNVDALNRNVESATALENGMVFQLETMGTVANREDEVWVATAPATSSPGLIDLWMLAEPEVVITGAKYRNLDPDPRNYFLAIGTTGSAFKPEVGDLILGNADAFTGTKSTNTFVNATNADFQLTWGATQTASVLSFKLRQTSHMSIGLGTLGTQRITAYMMECVATR